MSEIGAIALLELRRWLRRPSFWLLLAGLGFILAFLLLRHVEQFEALRAARLAGASQPGPTRAIVQPWLEQAGIVLMLLTPLLTMGAIAAERREQTWPLLRGAGLTPAQIVLGKMAGVLLVLALPLLLTALMPLALAGLVEFDSGHWLSGVLGLVLLLVAMAAAGIFFSASVDEPVNAALLHYGLLLLLILFHLTSNMPGVLAPGLYWLSPFSHFLPFAEARFDSANLLWFLLFAALFLWLAVRRIAHEYRGRGSRRQRAGALLSLLLGIGLLVAIGAAGQRFHLAADLSRTGINSVSPAIARLLQKLDDRLEIRAVVADSPPLHRKIEKALRPWLDASPRLSLRFITPEEAAAGSATPLNQTGRLELTLGGQTEVVKTLGEAELLRAMQRLIEGREAWIVFLEGHGEKSLYDHSVNGYATLDRLLRQRGFHTQAINLLKLPAIPDNTALLVLAGPTAELLAGELRAIETFIDKGGQLLLLRDPASASQLDSLLDRLGIEPLPGVVIDADDRLRRLLAIRHPAIVPVTDFGSAPFPPGNGARLLLPLTTALTSRDDDDWNHSPLLRSNDDSWNEVSDLKGHVRYDADRGERSGPLDLAIAAEREHRDRLQRAVVIGDSDFLDNEYIGLVDNAAWALKLFDWLTTPEAGARPAVAEPAPAIDEHGLLIVAILLLLGLPLLLLLIALLMWWRKRGTNARTA